MPKPACLSCRRFYRPYRNSVFITEGMPVTTPAQSGWAEPGKWKPYKVWQADMWKCQGCGHELITGWGLQPYSEHYKDEFGKALALSQWQINDC
jgi:hypothetical protein